MNSKFDIISSLLKSFDRFLVKLSDVDPEKVRTQKRYLILTFLFYVLAPRHRCRRGAQAHALAEPGRNSVRS
jgi:hypothetical protein